ncbi:hypothetical protein Trydic_g1926 [Trypoxylus dichotomus]
MLLNFYFVLVLTTCSAVQINYTKVPQAIRNNTGSSIILDCNYSIRPDDSELVVKWFLNNELVYQWVPPKQPQSLGVLKDRLDLFYKVTGDPKTAHRALKIFNPTTDIAGEYKCYVSTFADEDFNSKTMIVFEPERSLILEKKRPYSTYQNFTCQASEVYPQPTVFLFKDAEEHDVYDKTSLESVEWTTKKHSNGKFSVTVTSTIKSSKLDYGSLIFCELRIPGTGYVKRESLLYYPPDVDDLNCGVCMRSILSFYTYLIIYCTLYFLDLILFVSRK